ncbi:MAG TPA: methyltransferase domain-containing protein [Vicinamibacterales bacterium]|jgi:ubiquinone/menaquinone biosynthesis C-methylase UbiE
MIPIRRAGSAHSLVVSMTGAKMGERVVQIGCAHGGRLGAIAAPVGLSGRAVAIVPDDAAAARARKGAAESGVLVEVEVAPPTRVPLDNDAFDVAVIDDTGGLLSTMPAEDRVATVREAIRILRPGGRVIVIGALPRGGLGALFSRAPSAPSADPAAALQADGFKSVRTLAEREGLRFTEGIKPRT